jgi:murein DD-endopeptidase MepM/ murein hydrolase activator NlpD
MNRAGIKYILSLVVLGLFILPFFASAITDEERLADLRNQIQALEEQAKLYSSNIKSEQEKAASLQRDITVLKGQISKLQTQISLTGKKIDKTSMEIGGIENDIFDTQGEIDRRKYAVGRVLSYLNRTDSENLLEVLLKNPTLSSFYRQQEYSANINKSLISLITELKTEKSKLEDNKNELEGKKTELETLKQQQTAQQVSLTGATKDKNNLLIKTKGQEKEYQKLLADIEKQMAIFSKEQRELEMKVISGGFYIVKISAQNLPAKEKGMLQWSEVSPRITQGYGMTTYARRGAYGGAPHNGVDMSDGYGSPITAAADGQIVANGTNNGYGNWVAIQHPNAHNVVTVYAHMSALSFLKVGSQVKAGTVIGYEGSTGNSTGSHLHFSVYKEFFTYLNDKNGQLYFNYFDGSVNPMNYLP